MNIKIGTEIKMPFSPIQHKNKTGDQCVIVDIQDDVVFVKRFSSKTKKWNKYPTKVDRLFVEKLINEEYSP